MDTSGQRPGAVLLATGLVIGLLLGGLVIPLAFGPSPQGSAVDTPLTAHESDLDWDLEDPTFDGEDEAGGERTTGARGRAGGLADGRRTTDRAGAGGADGLRATDRGVSATSIRVGFMLLDLGSTGRMGVDTTGVDPAEQQRAIEAYVKELNDRGGILGRLIDPVFRVFDAFSQPEQRAACIAMTEDYKVFAVIAMPGYTNEAILCVTEEHATPLITAGQGVAREFLQRSAGRLIIGQQAGDRMMRNWVAELDAAGQLAGRVLGILSSEQLAWTHTIDRVLVPELEAAGHQVAHVTRLSANQAQAASQIPVEGQRMRSVDVDTVLLTTNFVNSTAFVQNADSQRWFPRWLVSEFAGLSSDFEAQAMPESYDGALAMTTQSFGEWRDDVPEPPRDASCREIYERETGRQLPPNNGSESNAAYPTLLYPCGFLRIFEAAATRAGAELTQNRLVAAIPTLGPQEMTIFFPGSYGPGKTDLVDMARFNRFSQACRCWRNVNQPRTLRFR